MIEDIAIRISPRSLAMMASSFSALTMAGIGVKLLHFNPKGETTYMLATNGGAMNGDVKLVTGSNLRQLYTYELSDDSWFHIHRRT